MAKEIQVHLTGAGSYTLVFCSECGPVSVDEGRDPQRIARDHLKAHGVTEIDHPK